MRARRTTGFTLLELLIVVAIIAILATLILGGLASARRRTQIAVARNNIAAIKAALQMYETDTGKYPSRAGHSTMAGANLFQNDIQYVFAALRNRRTLKFGGGPNSPYLDWKPEQVGKGDSGTIAPAGFGGSNLNSNGDLPSPPQLQPPSGPIDPVDYDSVMGNDLNYFNTNWGALRPDGGTGALTFLDPWGNPFVYVEWASVPLTTKDGLTTNITVNLGGGTGNTVAIRPHDPSKFDIYSFGPNGVNEGGDGDDVNSWSTTQK